MAITSVLPDPSTTTSGNVLTSTGTTTVPTFQTVAAAQGYTSVNKAGDTISGALTVQGALTASGGMLYAAPNVQTGSTYTVLATDYYITANASGTLTLTLGTATAGRVLKIRTIAAFTVVSASSNVTPITSLTPGTAILAGTAGKFATLVGDGTNWEIVESN